MSEITRRSLSHALGAIRLDWRKHFKVCLKRLQSGIWLNMKKKKKKKKKKKSDCSVRLKWCGFTSGLRSVNADSDPEVIKSWAKKGGALRSNQQHGQEKNRERPPEWQATAEFTHLETCTPPPLPSSSSSIARVFTHTHLSIDGRSHRFTFCFSLSPPNKLFSSRFGGVKSRRGKSLQSLHLDDVLFLLIKSPHTHTRLCAIAWLQHLEEEKTKKKKKKTHTHTPKEMVVKSSETLTSQKQQLGAFKVLNIPFFNFYYYYFFFNLSDITTLEASGLTASKQNTTSQLPSPRSARWTVSAWSVGDVHQGWALRSSGTQLKRREMTLPLLCSHWLKRGGAPPIPPPPHTHTHTHASLSFSLTSRQHTVYIHDFMDVFLEALIKSTRFPLDYMCYSSTMKSDQVSGNSLATPVIGIQRQAGDKMSLRFTSLSQIILRSFTRSINYTYH